MEKFITYREKNESGLLCFYILQKAFPHYVGLLVAGHPTQGALCNSPIAGYNLWISFSGCLQGNVIPSYKDVLVEITNVFTEMSNWYYINRIVAEPKRYLKFKITK